MSNITNTRNIEEVQEFLQINEIDLDNVYYCDYEMKYFNAECKEVEVTEDGGDTYKVDINMIEYLPERFNGILGMRKITHTDTTTINQFGKGAEVEEIHLD